MTDNRTGKSIEVPILHDQFIEATAFRELALPQQSGSSSRDNKEAQDAVDHNGLTLFDPSFMNTAVARSQITYIDGDRGVLMYRGYRIEELAERCSFVEVAYLLINGELPTPPQLDDWKSKIMHHTYIHQNLISLMNNFRYDAHPMGMLISSISALSTFYDEANPALRGPDIMRNDVLRNKQIFRILGKLPTIAACAYRHRIGRPYNNPRSDLSYTANFLYMMDRLSESEYLPHPQLVRALDILFILHADHEMNCSTATMRHVGSSLVDPYTAVSCAAGALYGPLHGGANEAVLRMLEEIGTKDKVPDFIEQVKRKERRLMGFGHRIYKNYDPRCALVKKVAADVFEICGADARLRQLWGVAEELEREALTNEYFISRKLYPNIDFYTGLIYRAMGFPTDMFPVLFCIPRAAGWLAHWLEGLRSPDFKIFRPRQMYTGDMNREFVPLEERGEKSSQEAEVMRIYHSDCGRRRMISLNWMSDHQDLVEEQRRHRESQKGAMRRSDMDGAINH